MTLCDKGQTTSHIYNCESDNTLQKYDNIPWTINYKLDSNDPNSGMSYEY
jgi:hypothetical protein